MSLIADALRKQRLEESEGERRKLPIARPPVAPPPRRSGRAGVVAVVLLALAGAGAWAVLDRIGADREVSERGADPSEATGAADVASGAANGAPAAGGAEPAGTPGNPAAAGRTPEAGGVGVGPVAAGGRLAEPDPATALAVERTIRAWQDSWMDADADVHLGFYAPDFAPPAGADRAAWERDRRRALTEPEWTALAADGLRLEQGEGGGITARFVQTYRDPERARREVVLLEMEPGRDARWRIVGESTRLLEQLAVGREGDGEPGTDPSGERQASFADRGRGERLAEAGTAAAGRTDASVPALAGPGLAGAEAGGAGGGGTGSRPTGRDASGTAAPPSLPAAARQLRLADGSVLQLDFIVWSESNPFVQIDGVFLEPGDRIAGWRVEEIRRDRVRLVGPDDREAELRIR